jgi:glycerophosphoryl diester phosphodiesterase
MKRFVIAVLGVFFFTALVWTMLFLYGQTVRRPVRQHPFLRDQFEILAHRGGSYEAPENTLAAFTNAASISPDIIFEMDVHFTKDQQLVVIHDDTVDRTTNGHGFVSDFTLAQIKELDAGYYFVPNRPIDQPPPTDPNTVFPMRGKGVKIPLLSEVFDKFPDRRMIVEVKPNNSDVARALFELVKKYNRLDKTIFASEYGMVIRYQRTFDNQILTAAPKDEVLRSVMLASIGLETLNNMPSDVYCIPESHNGVQILTPRFLKEANKRNKKLFIWTIDDEKDMSRLIKANVNGIITDRPKALESVLNTLK